MYFLRNIIAVMLALVIASPICCCTMTANHSEKAPSCCGTAGGKKSPDKNHSACLCVAKQPKELSKAIIIPTDHAVALEPPFFEIRIADLSPEVEALPVAQPRDFSDPPGLFLAMYSRWLI